MQYFNVNLEFDHSIIHKTIIDFVDNHKKGYICVIDNNVITIAQKKDYYRNILNSSTINTCDGSSIATLAGMIYKKKFRALNGPDLFSFYIEKSEYRQLLLGSSETVSNEIRQHLSEKGLPNEHLQMIPLPFLSVEQFDYHAIAKTINTLNPDIIWVSLGAPKQEVFMSEILPHLNQGLMFGIGAAFNFYTGKIDIPKFHIGAFRFIWLSRLITEPKKMFYRHLKYILLIPHLYFSEKRILKK
jgi:N-acetylglucosaminyldiphosphoundecaprenol N-acetyl-beta-D-mannosaminyltransferase